MARPPWWPMYGREFNSDPIVRRMSLEERGAYITLLCCAWEEREAGTLPVDPLSLSRLSGVSSRSLSKMILGLLGEVFPVEDGRRVNRRMMKEAEKQRLMSVRQRENVLKRWRKPDTTVLPPLYLSQSQSQKDLPSPPSTDKNPSQSGTRKPRKFAAPSPDHMEGLKEIQSWPEAWDPLRRVILDSPFLVERAAWVSEIEWWKAEDDRLEGAPKELDRLLLDVLAHIKTVGYKPVAKRGLRQKIHNCLEFAAGKAEREEKRRRAIDLRSQRS